MVYIYSYFDISYFNLGLTMQVIIHSLRNKIPLLIVLIFLCFQKKRRSELKKASNQVNGFDTSPSAEDAALVRRLEAEYVS